MMTSPTKSRSHNVRTCNNAYRTITRPISMSTPALLLLLVVLFSHDAPSVLQPHRHGTVLAFVPPLPTAGNVRRSSFVPGAGSGGPSNAGGRIAPALGRPDGGTDSSVPLPAWGTATKRDSTKLHMFRRLFRRSRDEDEKADEGSGIGGSADGGDGRKDGGDDEKEEEVSEVEASVSQAPASIPFFVNIKPDKISTGDGDNSKVEAEEPAKDDAVTPQAITETLDQPTAIPSPITETTPASVITPVTSEVDGDVVEEEPDLPSSEYYDLISQKTTTTADQADIETPSSTSIETPPSSTEETETPSLTSTETPSLATTETAPSSTTTASSSEGDVVDEVTSQTATETAIIEPPTPTAVVDEVISQTATETATIEPTTTTAPSSSATVPPPPAHTETAPSSTTAESPSDDGGVVTGGDNNQDDPEESDDGPEEEKESKEEAEQPKDDNVIAQTAAAIPEKTPLPSTEPPTPTATTTPITPKQPDTPLARAQALRAQAKRVRLEAERMDVILTLGKIAKIEAELGSEKAMEDEDRRTALKGEMRALKKRLGGGDDDDDEDDTGAVSAPSAGGGLAPSSAEDNRAKAPVAKELSAEELLERVAAFEKVPGFMQKAVAGAAGFDAEDFNATEIVLKIYEDEVRDFDVTATMDRGEGTDGDAPKFTQKEIDETVQQLQEVPGFFKNIFTEGEKNDTKVAVSILTDNIRKPITQEEIDKKLEEMSWIPSFLRGKNETRLAIDLIEMGRYMEQVEEKESAERSSSSTQDGVENAAQNSTIIPAFDFVRERFGPEIGTPTENLVEGCFPRECRREGEEPTEAEAKIVIEDVLSKNNTWNLLGQPEKVPGGFIIRGSTNYENGGELMEAIDANMATSRIRNRASLFYVFDPTPVTEEQADIGVRPPVLFLMGPQVVNDPTPLRSGFVSTVGVVTLWSSAIYPFLLNDKYMKLVEEQISFSDAGMPSNIDFINQMAYPLFTASLGIYFAHELAHKLVADANGMNITFPTIVPSFLTGITGTVTSLTAPPKNKQDLLDFAIVGPLAGMAVSTAILYAGITITASTGAEDYANLPALSLAVLRQSSLAGGIMEAAIPGLLNIPDAAGVTKPLSDIFIPLHPLAIAGFFGLLVNAVNLLPLGRTDGGRVGLALFGRTGLQVAGFITSVGLLIQGLFGSDLLLFFFSFVVFFQGDMEIPQQNEVDDIDFSRVLLATAAGFLVLLTLIPM